MACLLLSKPRYMVACAAAYSVLAPASYAEGLTAEQMFRKVSPSVMRVLVQDASGKVIKGGSAVQIAPENLITNCHVLAKGNGIFIKNDNVIYGAELVHLDPERDLCQIRARNFNPAPVELANSDALSIGQRVFTIGSPKGLELTLGEGIVSSLRKDKNGQLRWIQTSAPISSGSSGGGLFDDKGRLIGITTMMIVDGQALNFAIPVNMLKELPARSRMNMARMNRGAESSTGQSSGASEGARANTADR